MFDRLDQMEARYEELGQQLADPALVTDQKKFSATAKAHRDLELIVEKFCGYRSVKQGVADAKTMLAEDDADIKEMAEAELLTLEPRLAEMEEELKVMLLPKDPNDDKNIIIELRAGTGGDEAAIFVSEMFRTYLRFAEQHKWKVQVLSTSETGIGGGMKEVTAIFEGDKVYSQMKYESGVHRVQRVPATENQGRVHTSAVTVAVLPEAEEVDVKIDANELRVVPSLVRLRRAVGQHYVLRGSHHSPSVGDGRELPGREVAAQEPRKGHACSSRPSLEVEAERTPRGRAIESCRSGRAIARRRFGRTTSRRAA